MGQVWPTPIQKHEQLPEHAKKTGNKKEEAKAYLELGKAYERYNQFEIAKKCFNNALKIAKEQKDEKQESNAYYGLASANASTNEFEIASKYANKALEVDMISQYNQKVSRFLDEVEIEKLSTSNTNKGWSRIIGEPDDNKQSSHTLDSPDMQNTQHESPNKAYKHFEKVFADPNKYKKAINDYKNTLGISSGPEGDDMEISAYLWLGHSLLLIGQPKESLECYNEVIKRAVQFKDKKMEMSAYLGLGRAFSNMEDSESSIKYFLKALTMAEEFDDNNLKRETHLKLGNVYYTAGKFNEALKSYGKAQNISADLGARKDENNPYFMQAQEISGGQGKKKDDANIWFMLGNTFQHLKQDGKAIKSFQKAMVISTELKDEELVIIARERLGISYLTLASVCRKDRDYERAIELYEKALHIFGKNYPHYHFLREKALTGIGVALFRLGNTAKAIESIQEAQKLAVKDGDTGKKKSATNQKPSSAQIPAELLNSIEETCNLASTEWLPTSDLASLEKHIEEFSASNIYPPASSKEPLTKIDRKNMTENVKSLARKDLLNPHEASGSKNDEKFVDLSSDEKIYNLARDDVSKNVSTKIPARLLKNLTLYMKSIGQISCGEARGTCFLVADMLAMTNHHVFRAFVQERSDQQNPNLPITVTFDYLQPEQKRNLVMVEVDEERDPVCDSGSLDYKFFHLKENEGLQGRVPLGPIVRCRPLQEGVVVIMGHPVGSELLAETCVVVCSQSWREKLGQRRDKLAHSVSVHMTNDDLLRVLSSEEYQGRLPYDTTLFSGASGSPVFDVNGNIVAMHAQGYTLKLQEGKCSLMEFGVQFSAIYEDMRRRNVDVKKFFSNYNGEEDMDVDE